MSAARDARRSGSYSHQIHRLGAMDFRVSWVVDRHYPDSRLRWPRRSSRDTDRKGAERFAKRWGVTMPAGPAPLPAMGSRNLRRR